jgi:hypothetical protein
MLYYDKFDIWATGSFAPLAVEIFLGKKNDSYTGPYRKRENLKKKRNPLWTDVSEKDCQRVMTLRNNYFVRKYPSYSAIIYRIEICKGSSIYIQDNDIKWSIISRLQEWNKRTRYENYHSYQ